MKFKKYGKVYDSITSAVSEHCQKQRYCFQCVLYRERGEKCCEHYAHTNPEEVAHLLGFEVIEDNTPDIAEVVEKYGEDERVMQFHPPKSEYINNYPYCLHLWKPVDTEIPHPPMICV